MEVPTQAIIDEIKSTLDVSPHMIGFTLTYGVSRDLTEKEFTQLQLLVWGLLKSSRPFIDYVYTQNIFPDPNGQKRIMVTARHTVNSSGFGPAPI